MDKSGFSRGFSRNFPDSFVFVSVFDIDIVFVVVFVIVYGIGCNAKYAHARKRFGKSQNNHGLFPIFVVYLFIMEYYVLRGIAMKKRETKLDILHLFATIGVIITHSRLVIASLLGTFFISSITS